MLIVVVCGVYCDGSKNEMLLSKFGFILQEINECSAY